MAWEVPDLELYHPWNLDAKKSIDIAMECEQIALEQPEIDNSDGAEFQVLKVRVFMQILMVSLQN